MQPETLGVLVPILGIVMGIGLAMIGVVTAHRRQLQRLEFRHRERMSALEKGLELPPAQDDAELDAQRPSHLLRGLVWLFVGIAIFLFLRAMAGSDVALVGLVPGGVGLAYLVYYFVEGRRRDAQARAAAADRGAEGAPPALGG